MGMEQGPVFRDLPGPLVHWEMPANTLLSVFVGAMPKWVMSISPGQPQGV